MCAFGGCAFPDSAKLLRNGQQQHSGAVALRGIPWDSADVSGQPADTAPTKRNGLRPSRGQGPSPRTAPAAPGLGTVVFLPDRGSGVLIGPGAAGARPDILRMPCGCRAPRGEGNRNGPWGGTGVPRGAQHCVRFRCALCRILQRAGAVGARMWTASGSVIARGAVCCAGGRCFSCALWAVVSFCVALARPRVECSGCPGVPRGIPIVRERSGRRCEGEDATGDASVQYDATVQCRAEWNATAQ